MIVQVTLHLRNNSAQHTKTLMDFNEMLIHVTTELATSTIIMILAKNINGVFSFLCYSPNEKNTKIVHIIKQFFSSSLYQSI